ncbi:phosphotransferase enzyme family protein [Sarocladium implicatum]|nr:phosphotransferase enzyme family protein [Sarocladium implicatum]
MAPQIPAPPTPGRVVRTLILLFVKASRRKILKRILPRQIGLLHVSNICIKTKPDENLSEAFAMQFVAHHTSIPVQKVHCAFIHKGTSYIVMEHIKGQMAVQGWQSRSEESRTRILDQLRDMITELRSVRPPEGTKVGSVDGGPLYDSRLPSRLYWGPYASVREFHEALVDNVPWDADYTNYPELYDLFAFYRQAENELVLTHGDLSSLNILVRGDEVVGIVDWETAGWFPAYREYTTAKYVNPANPSWADPVDQFLTPMLEEWKMESIRRRYFGAF